MEIAPQLIGYVIEAAGTVLATLVAFMVRTLLTRQKEQGDKLDSMESSMASLERQVALDLRGLDVRLSFIEGQMGIKK